MNHFEIAQQSIRKGLTEIRFEDAEDLLWNMFYCCVSEYTIGKLAIENSTPYIFIWWPYFQFDYYLSKNGRTNSNVIYSLLNIPKAYIYNAENVRVFLTKYLEDFLLEQAIKLDNGKDIVIDFPKLQKIN